MIEKFYYEMKPFLYLFLALAGIVISRNSLGRGCAYILTACALMIIYWRYQTRLEPNQSKTFSQRR